MYNEPFFVFRGIILEETVGIATNGSDVCRSSHSPVKAEAPIYVDRGCYDVMTARARARSQEPGHRPLFRHAIVGINSEKG